MGTGPKESICNSNDTLFKKVKNLLCLFKTNQIELSSTRIIKTHFFYLSADKFQLLQ